MRNLLVLALFAIAASSQGNKITCTIPPVGLYEDTVLTCHFPEDLSAVRRDFAVYHYVTPGSPETVLDCWWLRGKMDCFVKSGFEYNRIVRTNLTFSLRQVKPENIGTYACQVSNNEASSTETCELKVLPSRFNTCNITIDQYSPSQATLTCSFNEDIGTTRRNFSVYRHSGQDKQLLALSHPSSQFLLYSQCTGTHWPGRRNQAAVMPQGISAVVLPTQAIHLLPTMDLPKPGVTDCWWQGNHGRPQCHVQSGYLYNYEVSSVLTIQIIKVTSDTAGNYSCWHTDTATQNVCSLHVTHRGLDNGQHADRTVKILATWLSLGLFFLGVAAVTLIVLRRRRTFPSEYRSAMESLLGKGESKPDFVTKRFQEHLVKQVSEMYPNWSQSFYFVPPVFFNRTRYRQQSVGGQSVYVPDPSDPSDVRHDLAMQHVIHCLRHMAESQGEVMFVLTQFRYEDYLNSPDTDYLHHRLPLPAGLRQKDNGAACFDFLIVHRLHGLLVGVVKAVSDTDGESQNMELNVGHVIVQEVTEAVQQLEKAKLMIQHLMSDQKQHLPVRQTLILPNLGHSALQDAFRNHPYPIEKLRECLAVHDNTALCLCAEQLSDSETPWDVSHTVVANMERCWKWNVTRAEDVTMTDQVYLEIIARFFGPGTQLSLRVPDHYERFSLPKFFAEAVSLTGDLYGRTMMTKINMDLLEKSKVFLVGRPNTGKTRMMTLVGREWLASGHDVVIVKDSSVKTDTFLSRHLKSLRTSRNTQPTAECVHGNVYDEMCDFKSRKATQKTNDCIKKKSNKKTCVLLDAPHHEGTHIVQFCHNLYKQVEDLHLWASCTGDVCPELDYGIYCTEIQNCPPVVMREIADDKLDSGKGTSTQEAPDYLPPTDGPPVKHIYHTGTHSVDSPRKCPECAREVGSFLVETLFIKATAEITMDTKGNKVENQTGTDITEPTFVYRNKPARLPVQRESLIFGDILIVFEFQKLLGKGDIRDQVFIKAFKEMDIEVQVINTDEPNIADNDSDIAKALHIRHMQTYRTKKKIVVYVEANSPDKDDENRRRAFTSCTSQLILVHARQQKQK